MFSLLKLPTKSPALQMSGGAFFDWHLEASARRDGNREATQISLALDKSSAKLAAVKTIAGEV